MENEAKAAFEEMNRRLDYLETALHEFVIKPQQAYVNDKAVAKVVSWCCPNCGFRQVMP